MRLHRVQPPLVFRNYERGGFQQPTNLGPHGIIERLDCNPPRITTGLTVEAAAIGATASIVAPLCITRLRPRRAAPRGSPGRQQAAAGEAFRRFSPACRGGPDGKVSPPPCAAPSTAYNDRALRRDAGAPRPANAQRHGTAARPPP